MNDTQVAILIFLETLPPKHAVSVNYIARKISMSYGRVHNNLWKLYDNNKVKYVSRHTRNHYYWYISPP